MATKNRRTMISGIVAAACLLHAGDSRVLSQDSWGGAMAATNSNSWGWNWNGGSWPGTSGTGQRWILGVDGSNSNLGVSVERVNSGSAAARAGIAPGDLIVGVGSSRVGRVGQRIIDLSDQLNRDTDARGRVELLVQSRRTMQLSSLFVQLDSADQSAITGQLLLPGNVRLPNDAVITVQLDNVSRPHYAVRNGHFSFRAPMSTSGAISFNLHYDRNYIFASDTYHLSAYVTSRGSTIYVTSRPALVLTRGNPTDVRMQLVPASQIALASAGNVNDGSVYTSTSANYDWISQRVTDDYLRYLERRPSSLELAAWHQVPNVEYRLRQLPSELMASQEYFDRVGYNNSNWVRRVFGEVMGREPTAVEFDQWMRRLAEVRYSRTEVLKQMREIAGK